MIHLMFLKVYAQKYNADLSQWYFLTGPRKNITELLVNDFRVGHVEDIAFHSIYFVLVDDMGRVRGYYDGTNEKQLKNLVVDLAFQRKRSQKRQMERSKEKQ